MATISQSPRRPRPSSPGQGGAPDSPRRSTRGRASSNSVSSPTSTPTARESTTAASSSAGSASQPRSARHSMTSRSAAGKSSNDDRYANGRNPSASAASSSSNDPTSRDASYASAAPSSRLGDTLLRKASPATSSLRSFSSSSQQQQQQQQQQHLAATRTSDSRSSSTSSSKPTPVSGMTPSSSTSNGIFTAATSPSTSLMGPPKARPSAGRTTSQGSDLPRSAQSQPPLPTLPNFDSSLHSPIFGTEDDVDETALFDDSMSSFPSLSGLTPPPRLNPADSIAASPRHREEGQVLGSLAARRPNLHIKLDEPAAPSSRFSAFSSTNATPDVSDRKSAPRANSTLSASARSGSSSVATTPSREPSQSMAGLGLGLPSSLGSNQSSSGGLSASSSLAVIPQTPERRGEASPQPSPSNYDRAGQIGLGELSTPRWAGDTSMNSRQWGKSSRSSEQPPTPARASAKYREATSTAQRHSRAISLTSSAAPIATAQRSPSGPSASMAISPSMPAHGITNLTSISSLTRDFGNDPTEYMRSLHEMSGGGADSPPFSINAMSESDSSIAAHGNDELVGLKTAIAQSQSKAGGAPASPHSSSATTLKPKSESSPRRRAFQSSPRIGDLAWSGEETGPFGVSSSSPKRIDRAPLPQVMDPYGVSEDEYRGSFDLNSAIADLLKDDEDRRQRRKDMGIESDTESVRSTERRASRDASGTAATSKSISHHASPLRKPSDLPNLTERASQLSRVADGAQRTRHSSSPGQVLSSASNAAKAGGPRHSMAASAAMAPSTSQHSGNGGVSAASASNRNSKRASSASIGHTLLRGGSLHFGASADETMEAAEALRKLDGIGSAGSRRRSGSRERQSTDAASAKSPRVSKSYSTHSRPGSAGRRTPGSNSRPSSPASGTARTQRSAEASARQRTSEDSRHRRTSRNLSRPRYDDLGGASPKISLDSPVAVGLASPRTRKSALPPLPTSSTLVGANASPAASAIAPSASNKRVSAVSVASRDSTRDAPVTAPTPATAASRSSMSGPKTGRGSDASSQWNGSTDTPRTESVDDDERSTMQQHGGAPASGNRSGGATPGGSVPVIPPVPPLPKVWEASRSASNSNLPTLAAPATGAAAAGAPASHDNAISAEPSYGASPMTQSTSSFGKQGNESSSVTSPQLDSSSSASGAGSRSVSKKWSFSSLSNALGRSPSAAKKAHEDKFASPPLPTSPIMSGATTRMAPRTSGETGSTAGTLKMSVDDANSSFESSSRASTKQTPQSPARRTPSFFRRRQTGSSDAPFHASSSSSSGGMPSSTAKQSPDFSSSTRSPPPTAGRSSRKSILGLGSLLKGSGSRRSIAASSSHDESQVSTMSSSMTVPSLSTDEGGTPSSSSKMGKATRRTSLIGRRRGKTLPSSTDPPVVPQATLPPMQLAPITQTPALRHVNSKAELTGAATTVDDSNAARRRLANSNSTGDLQAKSRPSAGEASQPQTPRAAMPTIHDNSPGGHTLQPLPTVSDSGAPATTSSISRIPRATGSIRRTPLRAHDGTGNSEMTPSGSFASVRRLSSYGGTALPSLAKSATMASLASNFGIQNGGGGASGAEEDSQSTASSENTLKGKEARRKSATTAHSTLSSSTSSGSVSSTVQPILNAYNAAKTTSEVDGALRRARITAYSSNLSSTDRDALNNLFARHEAKTKAAAGSSSGDSQPTVVKAKISDGVPTRVQRQPSTSSTASKDTLTAGTTSSGVPRRVRTSTLSSSSAARAARESALTASSTAPSSARSARALSRGSPSTLLDSRSTSAASTAVDDEERLGDEEMEAYIRRSHAKKLASGVSQEELDKMLKFPEPEPPGKAYSPRQAEALYGNQLSDYELKEMFQYQEIFYVGNARQKIMATQEKSSSNHGYDDERGDYIVVDRDHLAYRYEIVGTLGRGSFGQVLQCKDRKTGRSVAIKLIRNKKRFHHQALVEVKILQNLVQWDPDEQYNVIKMTDSFYFRNHLCISMELLSINLYELIKANSFAGFTTGLIRRFSSQVLLSLSLMRHHRVVHCDLKPENILLKHPRKSAIKVIDFGSSCFEHEKVYTYIQSRFYRSPEVILGMNYHTAIDIWSLGCILAELYTGYPLFPGENEQEQLSCIMEVLGVPDRYLVDRSSRKKLFFDSTGSPRPYVSNKGKRRRPATRTLGQALKCNDELFLDFLARCLVWDPERRIKPEAALRHAWIRSGSGAAPGTPAVGGGSHIRQPSLSLRGGSNAAATASSAGAGVASTPRTARASLITSSATTAASVMAARASTATVGGGGTSGGHRLPSTPGKRSSLHGAGGGAGGASSVHQTPGSVRRSQQQQQQSVTS